MILSSSINIKSCIICFTHQTLNETSNYFNDRLGRYHRYVYLIDGTIYTEVTPIGSSAPDSTLQLVPNKLYDIKHTKGKIIKGITTDTGATMIFFNPIPMDSNISIEIIKDKQAREIKATKRTAILCISGSINVNDKIINPMRFASLPLNQSVTLKMEDRAICALVTG